MPISDTSETLALEFRRYMTALHRRKGLIATSLLLSLTAATLYNYTARPVYQATSQILISRRNPNILPGQQRQAVGETTDLETQLQLLQSRTLAERVVQEMKLHQSNELRSGPLMSPWERFRRKFLGWQPAIETDQDDMPLSPAVAAFRSRVAVRALPRSRLVNISFRAYGPSIARDGANALAQVFIEWSLEGRVAVSNDATGWLSRQLREQQDKVRTAERALHEYQSRQGLGNFEERLELGDEQLGTFSAALTAARLARAEKETLLEQLKATPADELGSFPLVLSSPVVRDHKTKLSASREERRRLGETLGPRHPRMIALGGEITAIEGELAAAVQDVTRALEVETETARQKERGLRQQLDASELESQTMSRDAVEYRVLKREIESAQELFQSLLTRTQETGLESELRATNIRLVEKAESPRSTFSPNRRRNYQFGFFFGLALGVGLSLLLEHLDNTIKTPEDIKDQLGLPLLGMVPQVELRPGVPTVQRLASETPQSGIAEAYRLLRTNLIFSAPGDEGHVLMVSSPNPGEGKTTTVANLAASLAQNGSKVLAVDADLRRPTLHKHFSIRKTPGLSDLIVGKSAPSEAVQVTRFKGLHVLPCGYVPPNPAELLGSRNLHDVLQAFRESYDWVLIDSAPILAMADTPVTCPHTDGLILVLAAEKTSRPAVARAVDQLVSVGGKVVGAVLNRVNLQRNAYYYSQYYGEYYRSYYADTPKSNAQPSSKIRRIDRSSA